MILAEDFWLRGKAAQSSFMQLLGLQHRLCGHGHDPGLEDGPLRTDRFLAGHGPRGRLERAGADVVVPKPKAKKPAGEEDSPGNAARGRRSREATDAGCQPQRPARQRPVLRVEPVPAPEPETLGPSPHLLDAPRGGKADDLTVLKGVGAKLANVAQRVRHLPFRPARDARRGGHRLAERTAGGFKMICARYDVVEQARARLA
jgi:hypothetical protein